MAGSSFLSEGQDDYVKLKPPTHCKTKHCAFRVSVSFSTDYLCLTHTSDMSAHKTHTHIQTSSHFCLSLTHILILSLSLAFFCLSLSRVNRGMIWWSLLGCDVHSEIWLARLSPADVHGDLWLAVLKGLCLFRLAATGGALLTATAPRLLTGIWTRLLWEGTKRDYWKSKQTTKQKVIALCGFKDSQFLVSVVLVHFTQLITH